jgi:UDP-3-O-[3-hydroxymyristoyl] glucosamine N-acyltransferase
VIDANTVIGDGTIMNKGVYVCAGITVGSVATIGKILLVDANVPDVIVLNGMNDPPDSNDCP